MTRPGNNTLFFWRWQRLAATAIAVGVGGFNLLSAVAQSVNGDSVIRAKAGSSEIVIRTTSRLAGAIDSLTWNGKEFIDSWDHGRQLQSAWNANAGIDPIQNETFNPTEAGSCDDGQGNRSSSKLLDLHATSNVLQTFSQPAFWLAPGEKSEGNPARNRTVLSDHRLRKRVTIGYRNLARAIDYEVTISIPASEHHTVCAVEALTGYMPPEFDKFWALDENTGQLQALNEGPGEEPHPVILSTTNGKYAMGAFSPRPSAARDGPAYGRWNFRDAHVVKWNCVYRIRSASGLGGDYRYRVFVAVGTLQDVKGTLLTLTEEFKSK